MASVHSFRAGFRGFRAVVLAGLVIQWAATPVTAGPVPQAADASAPQLTRAAQQAVANAFHLLEPQTPWPQEIGAAEVTAPERTMAAGSFAKAIAREAVRLAAVQPGGNPAESNWSRVRTVAPGTDIILTVKGAPPGVQRTFVAEGDSDLTVLNVADPGLPAAARDVLRGVALRDPGDLPAAQQGRQITLRKDVRIGPDGVFVSDRKVADLGQVVETIARDDVVEITTRQKGRGFWGHVGPVGGAYVATLPGAMAGGFGAILACKAAGTREDRCPFLTSALVGEIVGAIAGGAYGSHAANRVTEVLIYRAPWLVREKS